MDRYTQLVNTPGRRVRRQAARAAAAGRARAARARRAGDRRPGAGRRRAGGRLAAAGRRGARRAWAPTVDSRSTTRCARRRGRPVSTPPSWNPEAPVDRRSRRSSSTRPASRRSAELDELQRFFHPTIRRVEPSGRVIVLGTPPEHGEDAGRGDRAARARGLHALARQGGRARRDRQARLRRAGRRGRDRVDAALLPLAAVGLRRPARSCGSAPGGAGAGDRLGAAAAGKVALVTGASRGIGAAIADVARARRRARRRPRRAGAGGRPRAVADGSAARRSRSTSPPPTRRRAIAEHLRSSTAASTSSSTTPASPATARSAEMDADALERA